MRAAIVYVSVALFVLSGCRVGPDYHPPEVPVPEEWKAPHSETPDTRCLDNWWEIFEDSTLNELEEWAIENSPTLLTAMERVAEARAVAGISQADLLPQATLNPSYTQTDLLFKIYLPGNSGFPGISPLQAPFRVNEFQYALPLNLSYQLDLWGKVRGQYESATYHAQAQAEELRVALLTLTTDLAMGYFQLRSLDAQLDSARESLEARRQGLALAESRYAKGLVNALEVSNAQYVLSNLGAEFDDLQRQRLLQQDAIALLLGEPASDFRLESEPLREPPPSLPPGIPSEVILQRPDIAEAERQMAAEHALIGVAYANFFPSVNLTAALGFVSPTLHDFLSWKSRYWSWSTNAAQTVVDFGRNRSNLEAVWARFRQASGSYQNTVLTAFKEVEDALNNLELQAKQAEMFESAWRAAARSAALSGERYDKGLVNLSEVLNNQVLKWDTERSWQSLLGIRYLSTVQLIKSLGGGWSRSPNSLWHGSCAFNCVLN